MTELTLLLYNMFNRKNKPLYDAIAIEMLILVYAPSIKCSENNCAKVCLVKKNYYNSLTSARNMHLE